MLAEKSVASDASRWSMVIVDADVDVDALVLWVLVVLLVGGGVASET